MAAGVGEVDEVDDLSDTSTLPCDASVGPLDTGHRAEHPADHHRRRLRRRRRRMTAGVVAASLCVGAGLWQQHRAHEAAAAADAAAALAASRAYAARVESSVPDSLDGPDSSDSSDTTGSPDSVDRETVVAAGQAAVEASLAASAAATGAASSSAAPGPSWSPVDLGVDAADLTAPLDVQAVGTWPPLAEGSWRVGYRLVTGVPDSAGAIPCQVPTVRIAAWRYAEGGDGALPCRVMAAGGRGTAQREGTSGAGADQVQVREVVLVSGGRAASVAAWSTGTVAPPVDLPALGAAAAALLGAAPARVGSDDAVAAAALTHGLGP